MMELPHSLEIEREVLGAVLVRPEVNALLQLNPDHFYEPIHSRLWQGITQELTTRRVPSIATIATVFAQDATLIELGGSRYLAGLAACRAPELSLLGHAELLRDLALRRTMIAVFEVAIDECASTRGERRAEDIAAQVQTEIADAGSASASARTTHIADAIDDAINAANAIYAGEVDASRITIGMKRLEQLTGGVRRGESILIGGRPGMGKTALGVAIAQAAASKGQKVLLLSLEMNRVSIAQRYLTGAIGAPLQYMHLRSGPITEEDIHRLCDVQVESRKQKLWIEYVDSATTQKVLSTIAYQRMRTGLDLVVIDYLGLIQQTGRSKVEEIGEISKALKSAAMQQNICVIALHQLSRAVEGRENKRPVLADLRDSGNLEQDADQVWFPFREAYYLQRALEAADPVSAIDIEDNLRKVKNVMEITVAKNRNGQTGMVKMFCDIASNVLTDMHAAA